MSILGIFCQRCRGKGCDHCAQTGMRSPDETSSAQPHRFSQDHPALILTPSEPQDHPGAD